MTALRIGKLCFVAGESGQNWETTAHRFAIRACSGALPGG